jgi:hypothetical protein
MDSIFQARARDRWPGATVEGDGQWCCLVECYPARGAFLFSTYSQALEYSKANCGHAFCKMSHRVVHLVSLFPPEMPDDAEDRRYARRTV